MGAGGRTLQGQGGNLLGVHLPGGNLPGGSLPGGNLPGGNLPGGNLPGRPPTQWPTQCYFLKELSGPLYFSLEISIE